MSFRSRSMLLTVLALGCSSPSTTPDAFVTPDAGDTPDAYSAPDAFVPPDAWAAPSAQPPASSGAHATDGAGLTLAITHLYLGDSDRAGVHDANAWKSFGYDLDHHSDLEGASGLCMPRGNGAPETDGIDGTDNAFGHHIVPILMGVDSAVATHLNDALANGQPTHLFTIDALGADAAYDPLTGGSYTTVDMGMAPRLDGTDMVDVDLASLVSPNDLSMPVVSFDHAYLVGNVLVAHATGDLALSIAGVPWPIHDPTITVTIDAARMHGTNGTIAGVISTAAATAAMRDVAGRADPSLCSGPTIDSIVAQMEQASDVMADRTQDPTMPCDGISIGLGFDAVVMSIRGIAPSPTPDPDPCP